ncbi:MAG TPA: hypothetical protein VGJ26_20400 [Pirellulales bacterium]
MAEAMLAVGTRKGLLLFERQKGQKGLWRLIRESHVGVPVPYAAADPRSGVLWASLDHGHWGQKLQRSTNLGVDWQELPAPKYPEDAVLKEGKPATLRYLWVIGFGGADQRGRIYFGTEPGGLFVSDDGGESCRLVDSLWNHPSRIGHWLGGGRDEAGIHSIVVDPRDSKHVLIGVSCAGVFETFDDCASWEPRNKGLIAPFLPDPSVDVGHDPHLLVGCAAAPDVLWQQNHCGIFRSSDGARSWQAVHEQAGPANFGFAIAVDAAHPDCAWVVPAASDEVRVAVDRALCVCRTDDGGRTWQAFREGLPQHNCYDFAFRHALDVNADQLAFGTATGSLYHSDNHGESWQCLGDHLPPIYSVRFVPAG